VCSSDLRAFDLVVTDQTMPRLEDPDFTIRIAAIVTQYPGATPTEVANEVSDKIESALQQMPEVKEIRSTSTAGLSTIEVEIKYAFSPKKSDLAAIWTKVRNKVADAALQMPPGAGQPFVNDDFGDVYGIYYALTSDGFSPREMMDYAKSLRTDLLAVNGVGKVFIQGELPESVYIELSQEQIAASGHRPLIQRGDLGRFIGIPHFGRVARHQPGVEQVGAGRPICKDDVMGLQHGGKGIGHVQGPELNRRMCAQDWRARTRFPVCHRRGIPATQKNSGCL